MRQTENLVEVFREKLAIEHVTSTESMLRRMSEMYNLLLCAQRTIDACLEKNRTEENKRSLLEDAKSELAEMAKLFEVSK